MTAYEGQIKVWDSNNFQWVYKSVRPTGNKDPYRYPTKEAAQNMLDMCYPGIEVEKKLVVEVEEEPNINIQYPKMAK